MKKYNYEKYHDASLQRAFVRLYQTEPKKEYARSITKSALTLFDKTLKNIPTANPMKLYMATFEWIKFVHEQQLPHEEEVAMIDDAQLLEQISIHLQRQLDGWFAPEVAMYFENPHFMNGSFYHRAQQFRVRVDDLYESIDVIIQIIEHLQINDVDVALPATEEIHDSSNKMYFLLKDFNDFYALPQKAALQRGRLFEQQLNESPTYLTYTYDTMLTLKREQLNDRGLLPQQSRILNIYEYYQQTAPFLENPYRNPMKEQAAWTYEEVGHAPKIVEVYNEQQQLIQRHFYSEYRVMRVEHFVHTQCVREDVFDANGYLSKTTQFIEGTTPFVETYYTTMGLPVLYKYFQQNELSAIQLMDHTGTVIRYFDNEQQFVAYGFNEFFKRQKTVNAYIFNEQDAFLRPILEKLPGKKVQVAHEYTTAFAQETNIVTPKIVEGITATTIPYTAWTNEIVAMADRYEGKVAVIGEYLNDEQLLPLINVMAETIKQLPYVKFYIYGGTYSKTQCMQYISQFSLQQNVFIEPVTLLSTMYESAQFTFAPTTVDSISVLEAISFGCPVITFDQASPYIDTAASGYQLQVGEWSMVTQRLVENLQDLQRLHLLSEAAYKKAQLFAPHLVAKKWHSFLQTTH